MHSKPPTVLELLRRFESRNVTYQDPDGTWPIVWDRAKGNYVWDADGRKYLDLTAAFGVAAAGHANPAVVRAGQRQMGRLLHAMGDVHPHALKAQLARELSRITFERWAARAGKPASHAGQRHSNARFWGKTVFCNSGFEAVEAALKTALLATGKPGVIAFEGGYHGLGYGALNATHRLHFRGPFHSQLVQFGQFVPFPETDEELRSVEKVIRTLIKRGGTGAIIVEPVQARGGIRVPASGFLPLLSRLCEEHQLVLILDEVYTGFGRTGRWFACEHWRTTPDLICLGKALTGGFPLSACVGRADLMDRAWPISEGEAIHTSTFLGHPVGCAMALAQIQVLENEKLVDRSARLGEHLLRKLRLLKPRSGLEFVPRGLGLLVGLEIRRKGQAATALVLRVIKAMLHKGYILLPEGEQANVIAFSPPLIIAKRQLEQTLSVLENLPELS